MINPEFRAWNTVEKCFLDWTELQYLDCPFQSKDLVFYQWTGLRDINYTKIFDGDIVDVTFFSDKTIVIRGQITFIYAAFQFASPILKGSTSLDIIHQFKAIGNVHEHPMLLENIEEKYLQEGLPFRTNS